MHVHRMYDGGNSHDVNTATAAAAAAATVVRNMA